MRLSSVLHEPHSIQCSLICYNFTTTTFSLKKRPLATNSFFTSSSHIKNYILPCIIFSVSRLCIISIKNEYSKNFSMERRSCAYVCDSVGVMRTWAGSGTLQLPRVAREPQGGGDGCGGTELQNLTMTAGNLLQRWGWKRR